MSRDWRLGNRAYIKPLVTGATSAREIGCALFEVLENFALPHTRLGNRGYIKALVTGATSAREIRDWEIAVT